MPSGCMLKLGPFVFMITTAAYETFDRSDAWRWVELERVGNELALQYIGPGSRTIKLAGVVYTLYDAGAAPFNPNAVVGTEQIAKLRKAADGGTPLQVTDGRGRSLGKWVISDLQQKDSVFFDNGAMKKQEFDLTIKYFSGKAGIGFGVSGILNSVVGSVVSLTGQAIGATVSASPAVSTAMRAAGALL